MDNIEEEFLFKIVIVGESGVGKTNILTKYNKNEFNENALNTIGVDFFSKKLIVEDKNIKIQFWDTAGQERYKSINYSYYKSINGAIIVYDITCKKSFKKMKDWINDIKALSNNFYCKFLILGNKMDLKSKREVPFEDGELFAKNLNSIFYETSAKTNENENINKAIKDFISGIIKEEMKLLKNKIIIKQDLNIGNNINQQNSLKKYKVDKDNKTCCSN